MVLDDQVIGHGWRARLRLLVCTCELDDHVRRGRRLALLLHDARARGGGAPADSRRWHRTTAQESSAKTPRDPAGCLLRRPLLLRRLDGLEGVVERAVLDATIERAQLRARTHARGTSRSSAGGGEAPLIWPL